MWSFAAIDLYPFGRGGQLHICASFMLIEISAFCPSLMASSANVPTRSPVVQNFVPSRFQAIFSRPGLTASHDIVQLRAAVWVVREIAVAAASFILLRKFPRELLDLQCLIVPISMGLRWFEARIPPRNTVEGHDQVCIDRATRVLNGATDD